VRPATLLLPIAAALTAIVVSPSPARTRPALAIEPRASYAEPAISPDGREIAFVSGGDIWTVPAEGGTARLLVSHAATESRPLYSPDGSQLAFTSTRTGNGDLYVLTLATGEVRRLTFDDAPESLDAWSRDGRWLYFSSTTRDVAGMNDVWRVSADGGTPVAVSADRYANEYWAQPSPTDPGTLAITARGIVSAQWWRRGHSHIDESELWLVRGVGVGEQGTPRYTAVTNGGAKDMWPMWGADGRTLYFVRDERGVQNLWRVASDGGTPARLTSFRDGHVLWPVMSADGRAIVFEREFRVWRFDVASGDAREVPITLRGASAMPAPETRAMSGEFQGLALSPDGRKIALVARGELFAASARDGGDAQRLTRTAAQEIQPVWLADSRRIVYASNREGGWHLYAYDVGAGRETQLTRGTGSDVDAAPSPDGRTLAFVRDGRELRALDLASGAERLLARGQFDRWPFLGERSIAWSPDSRWIAYQDTRERQLQNVWVVPAAGGEPRQVTFLANAYGTTLDWSPDGTYLLAHTSQRTEDGQIVRVDLEPRLPRFREDQFRELFRDPSPRPNVPATQPESPPTTVTPPRTTTDSMRPARAGGDSTARPSARRATTIDFEGIRQRASFLPLGLDVNGAIVSPDGRTALLVASAAGQVNLYTWSLDELSREPAVARQLTSTPGFKGSVQWSPDSREVWYLENGRVFAIPVESRQPRSVSVSAEVDVDFARERAAVFDGGWRVMDVAFYDPEHHGVDWNAVRERYEPFAMGARTPDELRRIMGLMIGELNASHLGVGGPGFNPQTNTGRLGLRFDRAEYERTGRLRITEILPLSPAALAREVRVGDYLVSVDGTPVSARTALDSLLMGKIGRRTVLGVARTAGGEAREVVVRPVNTTTEKGLLYRAWVESRRAYVERASGGRLGYVHMLDMGAPSLQQLYVDLDAPTMLKDGVVIDVRNNNGGFVNAYALDVFARRGYLTMLPRGGSAANARTLLGQRSLERPTVLVTNQHSLSDAEDFTEGYRTLGLGPVVGEPTAGWIIYTSSVTLLDGTTVRVPFTRITDNRGENMERNPRPVDVAVKRPIGESYGDRDSQLDAAVRALLERLGRERAR
jgi:Tol biopolymer transport system component/C-terminal processing protease CtpA/Prc